MWGKILLDFDRRQRSCGKLDQYFPVVDRFLCCFFPVVVRDGPGAIPEGFVPFLVEGEGIDFIDVC